MICNVASNIFRMSILRKIVCYFVILTFLMVPVTNRVVLASK